MHAGKSEFNPKINEKMFESGKITGIKFLDHIIISFKEQELIKLWLIDFPNKQAIENDGIRLLPKTNNFKRFMKFKVKL